ncbi:hypothetical protein GUJ93_ZPchr0015g7007 [Zizania palustris]|uniref:Uncharacterized protein n=1 Tax=Zizania palustris TaxID=103762 RepID=A0A8J5TI54_ZIZPA|nr:hypothetical protein GUJ93_ZPchr0015g7007 [Zizania palustris]
MLGSPTLLTPRATSSEIDYLASFLRLPTTPPHSPLRGSSRSPYSDDEQEDETPDYMPNSPDYTPDRMASPMAIPDDYFPLPDPSLDPS